MEPLAALQGQIDELDGMIRDLAPAEWDRPSACPGWNLRDVLVHLAQTNDLAVASVTGAWDEATALWSGTTEGTVVDDLAGAAVAGAAVSGEDAHRWWRRSAEEMVGAFAASDPGARVQWVVGDMAARTLCTTRLSETWIHSTDIAHGLGVQLEPTDRLWHVVRLVHRTLPYAFARAGRDAPGEVRLEVTTPEDPDSIWAFGDDVAPTVVVGPAHDICRVAGQRADAADTELRARGPDAADVLALMRTFA